MSDQKNSSSDLVALRKRIRQIDDEVLALSAERLKIAREIGRIKVERQLPIKDFKVEKDVIERAAAEARRLGIYEDMATDLARLHIRYAVAAQDEFQVRSRARSRRDLKRILIVGGRGQMGLWLSDFFASFGHDVSHCDREETLKASHYPLRNSLAGATEEFDVICLATPISKTSALIDELSKTPGRSLVFDVCSLKTPLLESFHRAEAAGLKITSVHPMFGPDVQLLAGRNIIFCESKFPAYLDEARQLFVDTTAHLTTLPLGMHDKLMSYVLGLSHMVNLVFARVLASSGLSYDQLADVSSTTFNAQLKVAIPVAREHQELYYEIQAENGFSAELYEAIRCELARFSEAVEKGDRVSFQALMDHSLKFFDRG